MNRDLTLRSLAKILLHKSPKEPCADSLSQRSCAAVFIERTYQGDLAYDLPQRSSHRELAESYLASLLFTTRVALAGLIFCPLLLQVPQRCRRGAAEVLRRCRRGAAEVPQRCPEVPHAEVQ